MTKKVDEAMIAASKAVDEIIRDQFYKSQKDGKFSLNPTQIAEAAVHTYQVYKIAENITEGIRNVMGFKKDE